MKVKELIGEISLNFKEKGVNEPELNSIYIIADVLGMKRNDLIVEGDKKVSDSEIKKIIKNVRLKEKGYPLSWILKKHNFDGLELDINYKVFVPRPETEELAQLLLREISSFKDRKNFKVLDFCSGSGCISLLIAFNNRDIEVFAIEKTDSGIKCIMDNIKKYNLKNLKVFKGENMIFLNSKFDIIVSNPPYIPSGLIPNLDIEVLMEPRAALDGGNDGLDMIRLIEKQAKKALKKGGKLFIEYGDGQKDGISKIFSEWEKFFLKDINGKYRFLKGVYNGLFYYKGWK